VLEVEFVSVESYDLSPDGEITLEIHPDVSFIQQDEYLIELDKPFMFDNLKITQGEDIIQFSAPEQVEYLKLLLKEKTNGTKNKQE